MSLFIISLFLFINKKTHMTIGWWIKKMFDKCGMTLYLKKYNTDYTMLGARYIDFDNVIDIGANKGDYVKRFRQAFPAAEIYAFEPLKQEFMQLQKLAKDKKIHPYNLALSNRSGTLNFYQNLDVSPTSSFSKLTSFSQHLWREGETRQKKIKVKVASLDQVMKGKILARQKTLVKIDVQGHESNVIRGGKKTLQEATACVIEITLVKLYEYQPAFDEIYHAMEVLGYEYRGSWEQPPLLSGPLIHMDAFFIKKDFVRSLQYRQLEEQGLCSSK